MSTVERIATLESEMRAVQKEIGDHRANIDEHALRLGTMEHDKSKILGGVAVMVMCGGLFAALATKVVVAEVQAVEAKIIRDVKAMKTTP